MFQNLRKFGLAATSVLAGSAAQASPLDDVFGLWLIEGDAAIIEIEPCGKSACGRIAWLAEPVREDGSVKLDRTNPDPALQSRPICGSEMLGGFERNHDSWDNGYIYNPDDGSTYTSTMYVNEAGELSVRGYVLVEAIGRSLIGKRQDDDNGGCLSS